jgi:hypothetical protein
MTTLIHILQYIHQTIISPTKEVCYQTIQTTIYKHNTNQEHILM